MAGQRPLVVELPDDGPRREIAGSAVKPKYEPCRLCSWTTDAERNHGSASTPNDDG